MLNQIAQTAPVKGHNEAQAPGAPLYERQGLCDRLDCGCRFRPERPHIVHMQAPVNGEPAFRLDYGDWLAEEPEIEWLGGWMPANL